MNHKKKKLIRTKINKRKRFFCCFFFKATQTRKLGIGEGLGGDIRGIE